MKYNGVLERMKNNEQQLGLLLGVKRREWKRKEYNGVHSRHRGVRHHTTWYQSMDRSHQQQLTVKE